MGQSLTYLYEASYLQWTAPSSWTLLALAVPTLGYAFHQDKRISRNLKQHSLPEPVQKTEYLAIASTFPVLPLTFYILGRNQEAPTWVQFSMETFASMYLALIESGLLSFIPVHERPSKDQLNTWETRFRGDSSFPSGHVIPMAALTFKAWQFYGPWASLVPGILTTMISWERVHSQKHYLSDVLGGILLAGLASHGVRLAAQNRSSGDKASGTNTPPESTFHITMTSYKSIPGIKLSFFYNL